MENTYSDEEIERCTLRSPREILFQLKSLIKRGDRISVIFQEGRQSFLTVLIDISAKNDEFYFDIGGSRELNDIFLRAEQSTFTTFIEGIRIQFSVGKSREMKLGGERVFAAPLPQSLLRLQRRELFRVQLPTIKPYTCRVRRGSPEEETLALHDISVGGIGVHSLQTLQYEQLEILENCWLDLRDSGMLNVKLEVRYVHSVESRSGKTLWEMGCKFVDLAPSYETQIQRFMALIEAERRALAAD